MNFDDRPPDLEFQAEDRGASGITTAPPLYPAPTPTSAKIRQFLEPFRESYVPLFPLPSKGSWTRYSPRPVRSSAGLSRWPDRRYTRSALSQL